MDSAVQGAFSVTSWYLIRNFLASLILLGAFACTWASAALRVLTLFTPPVGAEGDGCADRVCATDVALFSFCEIAAVAGMTLVPTNGWIRFLRKCERRAIV